MLLRRHPVAVGTALAAAAGATMGAVWGFWSPVLGLALTLLLLAAALQPLLWRLSCVGLATACLPLLGPRTLAGSTELAVVLLGALASALPMTAPYVLPRIAAGFALLALGVILGRSLSTHMAPDALAVALTAGLLGTFTLAATLFRNRPLGPAPGQRQERLGDPPDPAAALPEHREGSRATPASRRTSPTRQASRHLSRDAPHGSLGRPLLLCLGIQAGIALLVFTGWLLDSALLLQAGGAQVPMQFNTALCHSLLVAGVACLLSGQVGWALLMQLPVVLLAGAALVAEYSGSAWAVAADQLLWRHTIVSEQVPPGRMAPNSAIALLIAVIGLIAARAARRSPRFWPLVWACGLLICMSALAVLAGSLLGIPDARRLGARTPMALLTAMAFFAHGLALLLVGNTQANVQRKLTFWLPLLAGGCMVLLSLMLNDALNRQHAQLMAQGHVAQADAAGLALQRGMDLRQQALARMAERLERLPDQASALLALDAAAYMRDFPSMAAVLWLDPEGRIEAVHPAHYRPLPGAVEAALATLTGPPPGAHRLSAPLRLPDGRLSSLLRVAPPVSSRGHARLVAVLLHQELFQTLLPELLLPRVRVFDGAQLLYETGADGDWSRALSRSIDFGARVWQMQIAAPPSSDGRALGNMLLAGGLVAALLLGLALRFAGLARGRALEAESHRQSERRALQDQQRAEHALGESQRRLASVFESLDDAVLIFDADGRFQYLNRRASTWLLTQTEQWPGRRAADLLPWFAGSVHERAFLKARDDGRPAVLEGEASAAAGWVEVRAYPYGEGVALYVHDITARRLAELGEQRMRREVERAQRMAALGSWELKLPDGPLHAPPLTLSLMGLDPTAAPDSLEALHARVHPEDRHIVATLSAVTAAAGEFDQTFRIGEPDAPLRVVREIVSRVTDAEGRNLLAGAVQDVTERQQAALTLAQTVEELSQRNRELKDFAFVASHDLQEPLRKIRAFNERLLGRLDQQADPRTADYLARMNAAAGRMQTLIEDLLAFSRINREQTDFQRVELDHVLAIVLEDLSERIRLSGAEVVATPLPAIEADPTQMRQLLQNLISNALKFTLEGRNPRVRVSASTTKYRDAPAIALRIQDNGIGLDMRYAERIFVPFQRLHGRDRYEGTGIGLAIVRSIVERHCGRIEVESVPGEGATFRVLLPLKQLRQAWIPSQT